MAAIVPEIESYLQIVETDTPYRTGRDQKAMAALIRRAFEAEDIQTDTDLLRNYIKLQKYWPYDLLPWELFLTATWLCTFRADGLPRWPTVFAFLGRGAGKDGYIGFAAMAMTSPYNPAKRYDVDICAMAEEQAMRPVGDIVEVLEDAQQEEKLARHYYHTKELVQGRKNRGVIRGRTRNPSTKDGMRSGCIILNEVHAYENRKNIDAFETGLGKKDHPRTGIFSSNGDVIEGPFDDYLGRAERILHEGEPDAGFLPFICRLDSRDEVKDEANWTKANPSLFFMPSLMEEIKKGYREWEADPVNHTGFMTKRMGIRSTGEGELSVTDYEKISATKRPIDMKKLEGMDCTVGIDYAEINDFASVVFHFRRGEERYDLHHSWLCLKSPNLGRIRAPWKTWAEMGIITPVDDVSIGPELITGYINDMGRRYNIRRLAMDNYRWAMLAEAMRREGFDAADKRRVKLIRPSDIMRVDPIIQELFNRGRFAWGDDPVLRWATNNTKRIRSGKKDGTDTGNYYYGKIEGKSRKTDPYMALVAAVVAEDALDGEGPAEIPTIGAIAL